MCQCSKKTTRSLSSSRSESLAEADDDGIINVNGRCFLSEGDLRFVSSKRWTSVPNVAHYTVDYDDICGPWPSSDNPVLMQYDDIAREPSLCTWRFITKRDVDGMRRCMFDEDAVKLIIEKKLPDNVLFRNEGKEVFLSFAWEIFKYMRDNKFSYKAVSSALGLFYQTHRFFLANHWRTASDTYNFFSNGLELHAHFKPPVKDLIFNFTERDELLDIFRSLYLRNLELVRHACIPRYNLILKINK